MKPQRIILVRHGESEGNIDKSIYGHKPDYAIRLTEKGREQARDAGRKIADIIRNDKAIVYRSPFWRARETYEGILTQLPHYKPEYGRDIIDKVYVPYEDPRIREQDWGNLRHEEATREIESQRDSYGKFFFRFPNGESGADVFDRVSNFLDTFWRNTEKEDAPANAIIVTHGMTCRVFLMRFLHWNVETFETIRNPKNAELIVLELNDQTGKYELKTELRTKVPEHPYQYAWSI